ncbi:MAG: GNAT family N-acetyltransferase [Candidatus Eiseniibacteriota bacterium]
MIEPIIHEAGREAATLIAALQEAVAIEPVWSVASVAELLASPGCLALVAAAEGAPIGFAMLRAVAGEAELLSIGVLPEARRRGLGRALVQAVADRAAGLGARVLHLEVADNNAPALGLYRSLGFLETGRRPGYYADGAGPRRDALLFALALGRP